MLSHAHFKALLGKGEPRSVKARRVVLSVSIIVGLLLLVVVASTLAAVYTRRKNLATARRALDIDPEDIEAIASTEVPASTCVER